MTTWKAVERRIARILGGRRTGPLGKSSEDVAHKWLAVEVKHRKRLPEWIKDAISQATSAARPQGKLGIVVLHELNARWPDDLVLLRLGDFVDYFNPAGGGDTHGKDCSESRK